MAKKSTLKTKTKAVKSSKKVKDTTPAVAASDPFKLSESYISLALGGVVVVLLAVAFFALLKGGSVVNKMENKLDTATPSGNLAPTFSTTEQSYVLQEGEGLWDVAVKFYGDGYKWTIIGEENGYGEFDYVPPGTKLKIPKTQ